MSRRLLAGMAVAALAIMPFGNVHADPGAEGCVVVAGQGQTSFTVTDAGQESGVVGGGSFTVTIKRGTETLVISRVHAVPEIVDDAALPFQVNDQVTCEAGEGAVVAGRIG